MILRANSHVIDQVAQSVNSIRVLLSTGDVSIVEDLHFKVHTTAHLVQAKVIGRWLLNVIFQKLPFREKRMIRWVDAVNVLVEMSVTARQIVWELIMYSDKFVVLCRPRPYRPPKARSDAKSLHIEQQTWLGLGACYSLHGHL